MYLKKVRQMRICFPLGKRLNVERPIYGEYWVSPEEPITAKKIGDLTYKLDNGSVAKFLHWPYWVYYSGEVYDTMIYYDGENYYVAADEIDK